MNKSLLGTIIILFSFAVKAETRCFIGIEQICLREDTCSTIEGELEVDSMSAQFLRIPDTELIVIYKPSTQFFGVIDDNRFLAYKRAVLPPAGNREYPVGESYTQILINNQLRDVHIERPYIECL